MFIPALLIIAKKRKLPKYSSTDENMVYPYSRILFSNKKE